MLVNGTQPSNGTHFKVVEQLSVHPAGVSQLAPDRDRTYEAALKLVARIDQDLARGTRHYRNRAGRLLTRLDEVVRAILANDLLSEEA